MTQISKDITIGELLQVNIGCYSDSYGCWYALPWLPSISG